MNIIYSSKLYRSSNRKEKIRANMGNPINVELVQQLESYGDKEDNNNVSFHDMRRESTSNEQDLRIKDASENDRRYSEDSKHSIEEPKRDGVIDDTFEEAVVQDSEEGVNKDSEEALNNTDNSDNSDEAHQDEVSESSDCNAAIDSIDDNSLKENLNLDSRTSGVVRVASTDDECWIYYNDNVNLNNIIDDVIDSVINLCSSLSFNRLARKYNAVVFTYDNLINK